MDEDVGATLNRLLRGVATDDNATTQTAWIALRKAGKAAVPEILGKLDSVAWAQKPKGAGARYFGILLFLLSELDRPAFHAEVHRLSTQPLHRVFRVIVDGWSDRYAREPAGSIDAGVPVYISPELSDSQPLILRKLEKWSRTRGLGLDELTRIDVVKMRPEFDYAGLYQILYSSIIICWPEPDSGGQRKWWHVPKRVLDRAFTSFRTELTFYHEAGHHALGHLEGGQQLQQEEDADRFAKDAYRRAHWKMIWTVRILLFPLSLPLMVYYRWVRNDSNRANG